MKFRLRDRIALAVYSVIGLAVSIALGCVAYLLFNGTIKAYISLLGYVGTVVGSFAVALVMLVYSLCMLRLAFRHKPKKDRNSVTVQTTAQGNGEVRVSVQALDALVKQAIAGNSEGVADIKTSIVNHDDSISVKIDMSLHADAHIPNITMLLQSSVKSFIEEFSGIAVRDVSIMVKTIVPVMPQLAIEERPAPVVLEDSEHCETPAPQLQPIVEPEEEPAAPEPTVAEEQAEEAVPAEESAQEEFEAEEIAAEEAAEVCGEIMPETEEEQAQEET